MGRTLSRPEVPPSFLRVATASITDPSDVDWKKLLWVRGPPAETWEESREHSGGGEGATDHHPPESTLGVPGVDQDAVPRAVGRVLEQNQLPFLSDPAA